MLLLARTGSKEHNIKLAALAKSKGLTFSPHEGIKRGEQILASETEEAIFAALGLPYIAPEDREA
jgi:DNA polymerase (family 10)